MEVMCNNCPFSQEGEGLQLRLSLRKGRWTGITNDLKRGGHFFCHKTTHQGEYIEDEHGEETYRQSGQERICAGSIAWQKERGIVADALQVWERLTTLRRMHAGERRDPARPDRRQHERDD
jgi:hypothetical protein